MRNTCFRCLEYVGRPQNSLILKYARPSDLKLGCFWRGFSEMELSSSLTLYLLQSNFSLLVSLF